jgi:flavin-dependent dehydrogenase
MRHLKTGNAVVPSALIAALFVHPTWAVEDGVGRVPQSEREIPVIASVDVVVIGGTVAGVAAAESAAGDGAKVLLVAPRTYLGEDLCATLRLELKEGRVLETDLEKRLFQEKRTTTPGHVKSTLASVLMDAGVQFLFASYVTDVLRDNGGKPCGVVIANRAGRQAIVSKVIIDATEHAWVCRQVGCESAPWSGGNIRFDQGVVQLHGNDWYGKRRRRRSDIVKFRHRMDELDIDVPDLSYASLDKARQEARDRTFAEDLLRMSESLFLVPPTHIVCCKSQKDYVNAPAVAIGHFQPKREDRLYVLSGWADVPRAKAAELLRPAAMTGVGAEVGRAAAARARTVRQPAGAHVAGESAGATVRGDVKEILAGARPTDAGLPTIPSPACSLPVLAEVDVLVVGGGTAGAAAAIAAARRGARTLVVEYQEGLGGIGTVGMIGRPYHGRNVGFAKEVPYPDFTEHKIEWYRTELGKAGGLMWFGALGAGAFVEGNTVKGAVVCAPDRRGVVLAKVVIDATGNGDVAICAGADYMYGTVEKGDLALQGTGLPERKPDYSYVNTDYLFVDETDMVDVSRALVSVHARSEKTKKYDFGTLIQNRERRRVVGDFVLRYVDQIAGRTFPDSVVYSGSDYDSHGYPSSPFFFLFPHDEVSRKKNHPAPGGTCYTPYRCLLPRRLEGILVAGLGISMDRDVTAMVRMQRDIASQGYAVGTAAAMAVQGGMTPRGIDVRALQRHLIDVGALPEEVLTHEDSFPLPASDVRQAVAEFGKATNPQEAGGPLAIILTHRETALPLLQQAYRQAQGQPKLLYAQVLGVFGDKSVVPTLVAELNKIDEWDARILQGSMADHAHLPTPIDSIILSLGYAGDRVATPAIVRMVELLHQKGGVLSHFRAVALALERLRDPAAARPLADLLQKPGIRGYALTGSPALGKRSSSIREICLARALYKCGDYEGLGKEILEEYKRDIRGLFARHAAAVLRENETGAGMPDR